MDVDTLHFPALWGDFELAPTSNRPQASVTRKLSDGMFSWRRPYPPPEDALMTSSAHFDWSKPDAPEVDHNVLLNAAITASAKGGSWALDAKAHAKRCLQYLKEGVGLKPGVQVSSKFVCELDWGEHSFMQELFDAYVAAGYMGLDKPQDFPGWPQVLPLEAAILNGNISAVEACLRHAGNCTTLSKPMFGVDRKELHTLEELADIGIRPGMREVIKAALAPARAREEAVQTAEAMRKVISLSAPSCESPTQRRGARVGV